MLRSGKLVLTALFALFFAVLGIWAGTGLYTFHYAKGTSYLSKDPKACINCHVMREQYESWLKSSHHQAAACNDCHMPHSFVPKYLAKMRNGWNHSKAFTLQNYPDPIKITPPNSKILEKSCLHCHSDMVARIAKHSQIKTGENRCVVCHRDVGHMHGG